MAIQAQIIANTANAQFSTGLTTPEGKASSAANATKLGFHAKYAVLLTEEDHQAFDGLSTAFRFELHPTGPIERAIHGQITLAAWNIERANRLEAALAAAVCETKPIQRRWLRDLSRLPRSGSGQLNQNQSQRRSGHYCILACQREGS